MDASGFRTILCPIDFGDLSAHALRYASLLAECGQAKVIAVYANWFEAPPYFTAGHLEEMQHQFREAVGEALPADGILQQAAGTGSDLIVMGTHGRSGFNRWMLGSVTERILRESTVPLLTVRSAPRGPIRRILSPIDGTEASRNAFSLAARLGACFSAGITALYVQGGGSAVAAPDLCNWIPTEERARRSIRELILLGDPAEQIVALASDEAYDLLVIGAPHKRFFEGLVLGTTTLRAVRHAPCPVLTVRGPGRAENA